MSDQTPNMAGTLTREDIVDLTKRPSDAYNQVILQADYTTRAALSFYRFRQLGGDYHLPAKRRKKQPEPGSNETEGEQTPRHAKLKL